MLAALIFLAFTAFAIIDSGSITVDTDKPTVCIPAWVDSLYRTCCSSEKAVGVYKEFCKNTQRAFESARLLARSQFVERACLAVQRDGKTLERHISCTGMLYEHVVRRMRELLSPQGSILAMCHEEPIHGDVLEGAAKQAASVAEILGRARIDTVNDINNNVGTLYKSALMQRQYSSLDAILAICKDGTDNVEGAVRALKAVREAVVEAIFMMAHYDSQLIPSTHRNSKCYSDTFCWKKLPKFTQTHTPFTTKKWPTNLWRLLAEQPKPMQSALFQHILGNLQIITNMFDNCDAADRQLVFDECERHDYAIFDNAGDERVNRWMRRFARNYMKSRINGKPIDLPFTCSHYYNSIITTNTTFPHYMYDVLLSQFNSPKTIPMLHALTAAEFAFVDDIISRTLEDHPRLALTRRHNAILYLHRLTTIDNTVKWRLFVNDTLSTLSSIDQQFLFDKHRKKFIDPVQYEEHFDVVCANAMILGGVHLKRATVEVGVAARWRVGLSEFVRAVFVGRLKLVLGR